MAMWQNISIEEAELMLESNHVILFDMREYRDYAAGHHPRALYLSEQNLRAMIKHTSRKVPVIIYCYHGHKSQDMAQLFHDFGFEHSFSVEGGFERWFQHICMPKKQLSRGLQQWLEQHGFEAGNLDYRKDNNTTALMQAARHTEVDMMFELLQAGASVNLVNQDGNNALWMACQSGSSAAVQLLIDYGINLNQQNDHGATALMLVASTAKQHLVKLLLDAGADTHLTTCDDFSVHDVAASRAVIKQLKHFDYAEQACMA